MAKGFKSFLPQLSIVVPAVTTGMLIFSDKVDPITSLLSKSEAEKKEEDSSIKKTSKDQGEKGKDGDVEAGGKDGEKTKDMSKGGLGGKSDGAEAKGDLGKGDTGVKGPEGNTGKDGEAGAQGGSPNGIQSGLDSGVAGGTGQDPVGQDGASIALPASGLGLGQQSQGSDNLTDQVQNPQGAGQSQAGDSASGVQDNVQNGSVISGGDGTLERTEFNGTPSLGGPQPFAPVFASIIGDLMSEDL